MGRKEKNKKKGKGAEKTLMKTDKKLSAKQKKLIAKLGEDDIETIVAKYETKETKSSDLTEIPCAPPSARVNFSICSHPDKEEIFICGGEFFNGQKTIVYGDFYCYNVTKNEWKTLKSSICPAPRSGHQMVSVSTDGGQIWLFGGEFASPSQLQFYHYKDLWVYRIGQKQWEKINATNGPSARSGHRMVIAKKTLFVFGGFHDNNSSYRYFNDLFAFSLENYTWTKIEAAGVAPAPRSGCNMIANSDGKIMIWGGYSKSSVKKEIERGVTHADMFSLTNDKTNVKAYKWTLVKPGGKKPPPRSGMSAAVAANGKVYTFGGVMDTEEDEEDVRGLFSNDIHMLDPTSNTWRKLELNKKSSTKKQEQTDVEKTTVVHDDGVFTMSIGGPSGASSKDTSNESETIDLGGPSPRMNSGTIVCKGKLYVYGGLYESGSKQFTLSDLYSLDLHKLDQWKTFIANSLTGEEWVGSDSEQSSSDEDEDDTDDDEDDDDDDEEEDSDDESSNMDTD
ncbi:kelch domain-containing protein 4 [Toxorhynchites rutilus septentrionalis]|uniref:kelch domain-containing protein 4 n=1 Tax=Toxorhynchites rutilus septentrionalis TaxID=329112 RepID=UPI002478D627|nr:kelch domain-containing protein 4 [Toxorhynchites rutilus septentrionalis]